MQKKFKIVMVGLLSMVIGSVDAATVKAVASDTDANNVASVSNNLHVSPNKHYKLLFNLDDNIGAYNYSQEIGLGYVKNMVNTCKKYHAQCDIEVVIHGRAFPLVVKDASQKKHNLNRGTHYDYSNVIAYLTANNVRVITSKSSIAKNGLTVSDLLPNVQVADSATLYCAERVADGFYQIEN